MLFNSFGFLIGFLPVTLVGFYIVQRFFGCEPAIAWLVVASLFFYGFWNQAYLLLILTSIGVNFMVGMSLGKRKNRSLLVFGIAFNLALLGYYKYANFFVNTLNALTPLEVSFGTIVLPLAISFFTFQQIAYLVDAWRGEVREYKFLHYSLFVTFFPQLIAGPIVHHKEIIAQFTKMKCAQMLKSENLSIGITLLLMGLTKKVIFADSLAPYANAVFDATASGGQPQLLEAWAGSLAFSLQLYFDFSGYSDMALGGARLFGITLPMNFDSPYKSTSIVEFWRRWHITLSRFLRDYLYIPLGGNRRGRFGQVRNVMITMLLGGLWHGASWTFVVWGGLHGVFLACNHIWHQWFGRQNVRKSLLRTFTGWLLTFTAVTFGWVLFRADNFASAIRMFRAMFGMQGVSLPPMLRDTLDFIPGITFDLSSTMITHPSLWFSGAYWIVILLVVALFAPNSSEVLSSYKPVLGTVQPPRGLFRWIRWKPNVFMAFILAVCAIVNFGAIALSQESEFLYFQF